MTNISTPWIKSISTMLGIAIMLFVTAVILTAYVNSCSTMADSIINHEPTMEFGDLLIEEIIDILNNTLVLKVIGGKVIGTLMFIIDGVIMVRYLNKCLLKEL